MTAACLALQGCAGVPHVTAKHATTELPRTFRPGASALEAPPLMKWREYFSDPQLASLIEIALANNKEINIALQRISVAENEIQARRGEYLPFVSAVGGAGTDKVGKFTRDGAVEEAIPRANGREFPTFLGDFKFGLVSNWEIDVWKKLRNATKVAMFEYMATTEGRNFLITNLIAEVAHSYYELMALDNQLENLNQNITLQQNGLEMVRQLMLYARSDSLAIKRYEAEVAKNQARRFDLQRQITLVENQLNFLLGRTPQPIARASKSFMDFKPTTMASGVPSQLLRNRPDIREAELELLAAELNIKVAKANFYPAFSIKAGAGYNAFGLKYLLRTPDSVAASLAGDLVAPLVNKRAIAAQYKTANAKQIQAAYEYEQHIINAFTEVANQLSNIENLQKSFEFKRAQVDALVASINFASEMFKFARVDYLDVLLAQRETLEAKKELIETKEKQIIATVDLYKSLGGGWQ